MLSSKDSVLDVILIDVIRPGAVGRAQGWAEPLDGYLGADKPKHRWRSYLPAYAEAEQVDGKLMALPYFADAQFLYYRKDLYEKYKRPVPKTWDRADRDRAHRSWTARRIRTAGLLDGRRADRGHGVHVPRAAVGHRAATLTCERQAEPRRAGDSARPFEL